MNSHENLVMDEEAPPRSSMESRRSRMSRMTVNSTYSSMEPPLPPVPSAPPLLPETKLDVSLSLDQIIGDLSSIESTDVDPKKKEQMEKRQSNVLRLAQENEKLNAELKAMSERLAAAERRTQAILAARERKGNQNMDGGTGAGAADGQQGASARAF